MKFVYRCGPRGVYPVAALLATLASATPRLLAQTYSVNSGSISAVSGVRIQNPCFHLTGEIGRPALGFSSTSPVDPAYSAYSGFWTVALAQNPDEIFFSGYEAC